MKDKLGRELYEGDLVAYPARRGSNLELHLGTVVKTYPGQSVGVDVIREGASKAGYLNQPHRIILVKRAKDRFFEEDYSGERKYHVLNI